MPGKRQLLLRDCPSCGKSHELPTIIEPTDSRAQLRIRTPNGVFETKCVGICPTTLEFVTVRMEGALEAAP